MAAHNRSNLGLSIYQNSMVVIGENSGEIRDLNMQRLDMKEMRPFKDFYQNPLLERHLKMKGNLKFKAARLMLGLK